MPQHRKKQQLGMDAGTATHHLRQAMLFKLAKQLNLLSCYRCGQSIDTVDEMSLDHKVPWLDSDDPQKLFFDLENVAFSHRGCNCAAGRRNGRHKFIGVTKLNKPGTRPFQSRYWNGEKQVLIGYFETAALAAEAYDAKVENLGDRYTTNRSLGLLPARASHCLPN